MEDANGPFGVRFLKTLAANVARIQALEFNSAMTLDIFRSHVIQRILGATFPQLEKLTIVVNHSVPATTPYTGMPVFEFDPARLPRLKSLRLDGVALSGRTISTLLDLDLCNHPGRDAELFLWYPFIALINTATSLRTLRLSQYLHRSEFDLAVAALDSFLTIHGVPGPRFSPPKLTHLILRDVPAATANMCAYIGTDCPPTTIDITGFVGDDALLDPNASMYMFSRLVTNEVGSRPPDFFLNRTDRAVLAFEADAFVLCVQGPQDVEVVIRVERAASSPALSTSQIETAQRSALQSAAWFIGAAPLVTFACHETPDSLRVYNWVTALPGLKGMRRCVLSPQTGSRAQAVLSFLTALHTERLLPFYCDARKLPVGLVVKNVQYTPDLLQDIEGVFARNLDAATQPGPGEADSSEVSRRSVSFEYLELHFTDMPMCLRKHWEERLARFVGTAKIFV